MGLVMCSKKKSLALESHNLSRAEKEITACKAEQIHKMTTIFTQNDNFEFILFSASDKSRDSSANSSKLEQMEWSWGNHRSSHV